MKQSCNSCLTDKCYIRSYCTEESIAYIEESKYVMFFKKGQYIFREGDPVQGIYVILSGKAKVIGTGYNNKTQIITLSKSGNLLGHRGLGDKFYLISAVALEDSQVCFIETDIFIEVLKKSPELTFQLVMFYAGELRIAESRMKNLAQMTVMEKSAESLLLIKQIFGTKGEDGIELDVILSRSDIAELGGMNVEQITKCFSEFRKEKLIRIDGKKITILKPGSLFKIIAPYYPAQFYRETHLTSAI